MLFVDIKLSESCSFSLLVPPEKPKNLSCIVNEGKRMTCQWDPGRETYLETNFTLKSEWQVMELLGPCLHCARRALGFYLVG